MDKLKKTPFWHLFVFITLILAATALLNATYCQPSNRGMLNEFIGSTEGPGPGGNTITVTVTKVWANIGAHPANVTVQLYRNGLAFGNPETLSDDNGWTHAWNGLSKNDVWTADEINVPVGYVKTVTGSSSIGFVITNALRPSPTTPPRPPVYPPIYTPPGGGPGIIYYPTPTPTNTEPGTTPGPEVTPEPGTTPEPEVTPEPEITPEPSTQDPSPSAPPHGHSDSGGSPQIPSGPKTEDDANPVPWLLLLAASMIILRRVLLFRKRKPSH